MKKAFRLAAVFFSLASAAIGFAQSQPAPTLHIGDPAPPLAVKWLKGSPVPQYLSNQAYVVVFWSTWSPAFLSVIEHLNEITRLYNGNVLVIAVSVFEENQAKVVGYVNHFADQMDFSVAEDNVPSVDKHGLNGAMATTWLQASQQQGLPIAFIVDHAGKIAWIGTPAGTAMDEPVRRISDNTWDTAAFAAQFSSEQEKTKAMNAILDQMTTVINNGQYDEALKLSDELIPYDKIAAAGARYLTMLRKADYSNAYAYAKQLSEGPFAKNASAIYTLGWITVNPENQFAKTDYDLGLALAKQAVELSYHQSAEMLDLLAWAYYQKKDKDNAIDTEKQALNVARDDQKPKLELSLKKFQGN